MSYEVKVHKSVEKFLNEIQSEDRERLKGLILALENPHEVTHVKIKGETGVYGQELVNTESFTRHLIRKSLYSY